MRRSGWYAHGLASIERIARRQRFLCSDDVREDLADHGHDDPPDPNAVGALFNEAVKARLIVKTGRFVQSTRSEAKGRNVQLWQSGLYADDSDSIEDYQRRKSAGDQGVLL